MMMMMMMMMIIIIIILIIIIITHSNQLYTALGLEALTFPVITNNPPSIQSDVSSQFLTFHLSDVYRFLKYQKVHLDL